LVCWAGGSEPVHGLGGGARMGPVARRRRSSLIFEVVTQQGAEGRAVGASVSLRARGSDSAYPVRPLRATAGVSGMSPDGEGAAVAQGRSTDRGDHRAGRGVRYRQGRADLLCAGPERGPPGAAVTGGCDLFHDDPLAAGDGRSAGWAGSDAGGDGGHLGLLEAGLLPARGGRVGDLAGQRP
jgi:hypothetical protein